MNEQIKTTPSQLEWPSFLMNFPFTVDNRNANNTWMKRNKKKYNYDVAFKQFMDLYHYVSARSLVYILPSEGDFQDQPYVANLGCYLPHLKKDNTILLANFQSPPRIGEDIVGAKFFTSMGYKVFQPPYTWEGEADLKYIRDNIYLGGYGIRTDIKTHDWMREYFDMDVVSVEMTDPKLYHFDCSCFVLSNDKIILATKIISRKDIRKLEKVVEIIDLPKDYIYYGWTNALLLDGKVLHAPPTDDDSTEAFKKFIYNLGYEPVIIHLEEFEKSGADLSCMLMHLNYRNRDSSITFQKSISSWWAERLCKLPSNLHPFLISNFKN